MVRVFLFLIVIQVVIASLALIDCLSAEKHQVRALPRALWVPVILVVPLLGPIAWFVAGRPASGGGAPRAASPRPGPIAPDDNPEFLKSLADSARQRDEELFRRWEEDLRRREEDLRREEDQRRERDPDRADTPERRTDPDQTS
ncbi:PLD nuclease N-terminal domain-containing protein [Micromonospora cathayae]|uniref:PLD nuclease N-terminal domain-containing protein n=1 Tax=Micromonospora cathayae TaxID=3028804 RepID=A0ABY7ZYY8_9ACTN|nr:PLD nuclease N-terminal domain-containing protein [Micromonospora sp. HUAS 3]WDZ87312.1 PLD nuclease N-terminal domain-containing protein [Micromonospora sp. HUAS 3]